MGERDLNLERFVSAQKDTYANALAEIKSGKKIGHWMWYIFPQLRGWGGGSYNSTFYGIDGLNEAKAYLSHGILGNRLIEITGELLKLKTNDVKKIFDAPDDLKLKSSMTLFALADPDKKIFQDVLDKFFNREQDEQTKRMCK